MDGSPRSRSVTVHTFRGDRTKAFGQRFFGSLDDEQKGLGNGPSTIECLLFAGHSGVSIEQDPTVYGFNPNRGSDPVWRLMQRLRNGVAYPGVVQDDTSVFTAARNLGLTILNFEIVLSLRSFRAFRRRLAREMGNNGSQFTYGFPDGDGDCNCTTWIERIGLPLLTGRMDEFTVVTGVAGQVRRRFGL